MLIALLLYALTAFLLNPSFVPDSLIFERPALGNGWFVLAHGYTNSLAPWRIDPLFEWIISRYSLFHFYAALFTVFSVGTIFLLLNRGSSLINSALLSVASGTLVVLLFGWDMTIWGTLLWLPWLCWWLDRIWGAGRFSTFALVVLLFLALRLTASANQLAIIFMLLAFAFTRTSYRGMSTTLATAPLLAAFLPTFWPLIKLPLLSFPDYPTYSRVIAERAFIPRTDALLGQNPPLQLIDWLLLREVLAQPALLLLTITVLATVICFFRGKKEAAASGLIVVLLFFCVVLETAWVSESISQISPLHSSGRIVPGAILLPLVTVSMAAALVLALPVLAASKLGTVLAILMSAAVFYQGLSGRINSPYLVKGQPKPAWSNLVSDQVDKLDAQESYSQLLFSPSLALLNRYGLQLAERRKYVDSLSYRPISDFGHYLSASSSQRRVRRIARGPSDLRWSSGGGQQKGNEWLHLFLKNPKKIKAIKIGSGKFHSDFPRGLKISYSPSCQAKPRDVSSYKEIYQQNKWQGEIAFTPSGFPYLESESVTAIPFARPIKAQCLLVKQIGQTNQLDWSVVEFKIALEE